MIERQGLFHIEVQRLDVSSGPKMKHVTSSKAASHAGTFALHSCLTARFLPALTKKGQIPLQFIERREKTPGPPKISGLLRKRPVLLRAHFVLTKDQKRPYYRHFCGKMHREGCCSKAAGGAQ